MTGSWGGKRGSWGKKGSWGKGDAWDKKKTPPTEHPKPQKPAEPEKPHAKGASWGTQKPGYKKNKWVDGPDEDELNENKWLNKRKIPEMFNQAHRIRQSASAPPIAGETQVTASKGQIDVFNPTTERLRIYSNIRALHDRKSFPFSPSKIMPDARERQAHYNALRELGRPLHDYQIRGVEFLCSRSRSLLADGMGLGKSSSCLVRTCDGNEKHISKVKVGDQVVGSDGKPTEVLGVYPQGKRQVVKFTFSDDTVAYCDLEHMWTIHKRTSEKESKTRQWPKTLTVKEFLYADPRIKGARKLVTRDKRYPKAVNYNYYIPTVQPVEYPERDLPIDPWILGYWIGNGHISGSGSIGFTVCDQDEDVHSRILAFFGSDCSIRHESDHGRVNIRLRGEALVDFRDNLFELGYTLKSRSINKHIPKMYRTASIHKRWDLLCGLMDANGTVSTQRGHSNVNFGSSSYKVVHGIRDLINSLGGLFKIGKPEYKSYNLRGEKVRTENASWRGSVAFPPKFDCPFTCKRKRNAFIKFKLDHSNRNIAKIEVLDRKTDMTCIKVANEDGLFCINNYIVTHNTAMALSSLPFNRAGVVVVCPASVKNTWIEESHIWRPGQVRPYVVPKRSHFRFPGPGEITIVSWSSLPSKIVELPKYPFVLVLDEAHYAKSSDSKRHKSIMNIVEIAEVVIGLTGTPMANKVEDFWNVIRVCGMQRVPGQDMPLLGPRSRFGRTFFRWQANESRPVGAEPQTRDIMKMICMRRTGRDVHDQLPPLRMSRRTCQLSRQQIKQFDKILEQYGGEEGLAMALERAMTLHGNSGETEGHLMQLRRDLNNAKLPILIEEVESYENEGTPLVVYTPFIEVAEILLQRPGWGGIIGGMSMREKSMWQKQFNTGEILHMVITNAGATGINLHGPDDNPCCDMIRVSLDFSPATNDQVVKRIERVAKIKSQADRGVVKPKHIKDFYVDHRIDYIVWNTLGKKRIVLKDVGLEGDIDKGGTNMDNYYDVPEALNNVKFNFGGRRDGGRGK